jgi:Holliday junction resolvase RusA-like endonuclease
MRLRSTDKTDKITPDSSRVTPDSSRVTPPRPLDVLDLLARLTPRPYIFLLEMPITPQPKDRPRFVVDGDTDRPYTPRRTRAYEGLVRGYTLTVPVPHVPVTCPLAIALVFSGAHGNCDWDNLAKAVCDALQGIVYKNDHQIKAATVLLAPRSSGAGAAPAVTVAIAPLP